MVYNLTNVSNAANPAELFTAVNELTGGLYFVFFIFIMFLILMALSRGRADNVEALLASSFIVSIIAAILWAGGYIGWRPFIIPSVIFVIMIIVKMAWSDS